MGYAFSDPANQNESADSIINLSEEVVYRKKHMRLHCRVLKDETPQFTEANFDDASKKVPEGGVRGVEKVGSGYRFNLVVDGTRSRDPSASI